MTKDRMVWEFPAVSHTRKEFWGEAQYSRKGVLLLTVFLGIFGLHHLYLRSPQTALLFFFGNIFSFGYWWFFDILQLSTSTTEELNEQGLSLPWGPAGIAQGMFQCKEDAEKEGGTSPHPAWFMLSSLLLPLGPMSMLAAGDTGGAFIRFLCFVLLLFLFPFLILSYIQDFYHLLLKPADLLYNGFSRFFPFTLGMDENNHSPRIQMPIRAGKTPEGCKSGGLLASVFNFLASAFQAFVVALLPILSWVVPAPVLATLTSVGDTARVVTEEVVPAAIGAVETVTKTAVPLAEAAGKIGELAVKVPTQMVKSLEAAGVGPQIQTGGGQSAFMSTADKWAASGLAALVAGGFILAAGRSFTDAVRHFIGPTDTPPAKA